IGEPHQRPAAKRVAADRPHHEEHDCDHDPEDRDRPEEPPEDERSHRPSLPTDEASVPLHLVHLLFIVPYARPSSPSARARPGCSAIAARRRSRSRARSVTGPRLAVPPVEYAQRTSSYPFSWTCS